MTFNSNFYAVGWQAPQRGQLVGTVKNFRRAKFSKGFDEFLEYVHFPDGSTTKGNLIPTKFTSAISSLQDFKTNGNNTDVPFYRTVDPMFPDENNRISKISTQLNENLPVLKDFDNIRFYIIVVEENGIIYRLYIKALRTAKLKTKFIMTSINGMITVTNTENNGKALPYTICYAEKIFNDTVTQYIFNVQDYEDIFGLNESKIRKAKANFQKFIPDRKTKTAKFKISDDYVLEVDTKEQDKIIEQIETNKKIANMLSKYNGEAEKFEWEAVKEANELAKQFMQEPFVFDEKKKVIKLTSASLVAWVSTISNTKKMGIAARNYEDSLAQNI